MADDIRDLLDHHPGFGRFWTQEEVDGDHETWTSFHEAVCALALSGDFKGLPESLRDRLRAINRMVADVAWISVLPSEEDA